MQEQRHLKSPQLLLSKVQRRVWHIAWKIWEHRNKFLHETNHSYHPTEIIAINAEIEQEWNRNLEDIPREHSALFSGMLQAIIRKTHTAKLRWLTTIWSLREVTNPHYLTTNSQITDPMTRHRYQRWKENL